MSWKDIFSSSPWKTHIRTPLTEEHLVQYLTVVRDLAFGFEKLNDHVIITDPNANIIYANKAVERNTGFSREEVIGKNPADLWGGKMPKEFYEKMWHAIAIEKKPFVGEVHNKRKDGIEYWQELHISPILWDNGDVKFFIGIEPNITERKEKEKFRDEFISILAHQLKNPMASWKWALDWFSGQDNLTAEQKNMIGLLYKNNESLIGLVSDLLVLARIGNISELKKERIDVTKEIEDIIQHAKTSHPHIAFSFDKQESCFLISYRPLVLQVLMNIILNAAEYSDKDSGVVSVGIKKQGGRFIFSCKDNGIGIPPEDQDKIFTKFFRAANAKEVKEQGTGLGLFIIKMIADSLGWNVRFESKVGQGTTFWIEIPYVNNQVL